MRLREGSGQSSVERGIVLDSGKEIVATTVIDAEPSLILKMPEDDPSPFLVTIFIAIGFVGLLLNWWWMAAAGGILTLLGILVWLWPRREMAQTAEQRHG
jgi:cytochrome c oxidase subunit 1/cytochrome c oxidase subunit I+III